MPRNCSAARSGLVAPLAGSVDRNTPADGTFELTDMSLPSRGAWIEMSPLRRIPSRPWSLPSRGAWIEIVTPCCSIASRLLVAPLAGSVDRNTIYLAQCISYFTVAPLAGSVDRNVHILRVAAVDDVAPLAGSVDRNKSPATRLPEPWTSLPSRGAWIEII